MCFFYSLFILEWFSQKDKPKDKDLFPDLLSEEEDWRDLSRAGPLYGNVKLLASVSVVFMLLEHLTSDAADLDGQMRV